MAALEDDYTRAPISEAERVMLDYVVQVTRDATRIAPSDHDRLRAGVDVVDADIAFLTGAAAGDGELAVRQEHEPVGALGPRKDAFFQFAGGGIPHR